MTKPMCGVCGRTGGYVNTFAVPGAPVTIGWCRECLEHEAQPMFAVEMHARLHVDREYYAREAQNPSGTRPDLAESVALGKQQGMGPGLELPEWLLWADTWLDGRYVRAGDVLQELWVKAPGPV